MAEEVKIRISADGADQAERELQKVQQAAQQAAQGVASVGAPEALPAGQGRPGESVPQSGAGRLASELNPTESTATDQKAIGEQRRREYAARRAEAQGQAQDQFNEQLVREEEKLQNAEERKAKADGLRANRWEQSRSFTEDRMQEQLNEQLVRDEAKQQHAETRQQRAEAVEKARTGALHGAASVINGMGGANPFSGATGMAAGMGGPIAIGAEVAGMVLASMSAQADRSRGLELMQLGSAANLAAETRAATRMSGPMGSAEAAGEAAYSASEAGQKILDNAASLSAAARPRWNKPSEFLDWYHNVLTGDHLQSSEGEEKINQASTSHHEQMVAAHKDREAAKVQWERIGSKVLRSRELREGGDWRGAKDMENEVIWQRAFDEAWKQGAGMGSDEREAMAEHSGDLAKKAAIREENMKWAHLVNASSSRSDIARAVDLATGHIHGGSHHQQAQVSALEELVRMNREHHGESVLRRFEPRSLRHQGGHS